MAPRYQKYRLKWPLTASQVINIDDMFSELYTDLKTQAATSGDYDFFIPRAADTLTLTGVQHVILDPAGTIASLTIILPSSPLDGQVCGVSSTHTISALTLHGAGADHVSTAAPTSLTAGASFQLLYRVDNTTWYPTS